MYYFFAHLRLLYTLFQESHLINIYQIHIMPSSGSAMVSIKKTQSLTSKSLQSNEKDN